MGDIDWCTTVRLQYEGRNCGRPARAAVDGREVSQSVQRSSESSRSADDVWADGFTPSMLIRFVEVEAEVQLSDHKGRDADRRRPRVLWRHGRQIPMRSTRPRPQAVGSDKIGGAIAGGVITYTANGAQKVAVTTGYISPAMPVQIRRAKIAILSLEGD